MENIKFLGKRKIIDYISNRLSNPKLGYLILGTVSFLESIIFPISPLMVLIPLCLINRIRWLSYAMVVSFFSVCGSLVTFSIGYFCWESLGVPLEEELELTTSISKISEIFSSGLDVLVPAVGAFSPVTYNIVSAVCGFMAAANRESFVTMLLIFAVTAGIARSIRFIAETWLIVKVIEGNRWLIKNFPAITVYMKKKIFKDKKG